MSSSDSGDVDHEYHMGCMQQQQQQSNHQQSHHHHHPTPQQASNARRRSSYGQSHFSQPLSTTPIMYKDNCSMVGSQENLVIGSASPSRFDCYVSKSSRPSSVVSHDRYDENITCCLPPPSPAPNNDRFIMGIGPSSTHFKDHRLAAHHRTMSPSSRYRNSIPDRYRDMSPKCENYMSPGHFLANSTPMASNENFTTYLTSTVHTPVKRYIPTPPPSNELQQQIIYNDSGPATLNNSGYHLSLPVSSASAATQIGSSQTLKPPKSRMGQQQQQQPQYRVRMKPCCPEAQQQQQQQQQQLNTSTLPSSHTISPYMSDIINPPAPDHYATPPRIRPTNSNTNNKSTGGSSASSSATSSLRRSQHQQQHQQQHHQQHQHQHQHQQMQHQQQCDYISRTPSVEYIGTGSGRVITPMSMMSEQEAANSCLHCNTLRRTTGVHQTTQTTGPISPTSQALSISGTDGVLIGGIGCQSPPSPQPSSTYSIASLPSVASSNNGTNYSAPASLQLIQKEQEAREPINTQCKQQILPVLMNKLSSPEQPTIQALQLIPSNQVRVPVVQPVINQQPQAPVINQAAPTPQQQQQQQSTINDSVNRQSLMFQYQHNDSSSNLLNSNSNLQQRNTLPLRQQTAQAQRYTRKQKVKDYVKHETAKFFGVDTISEEEERTKWSERQKRLAIRCFGQLRDDCDSASNASREQVRRDLQGDRPDILPAPCTDETDWNRNENELLSQYKIERKASVVSMLWNGLSYVVQTLTKQRERKQKQWSRSFAPAHVKYNDDNDLCDGLSPIQNDETFFDSSVSNCQAVAGGIGDEAQQMYTSTNERTNGWRTKSNQESQQQQQQQPAMHELRAPRSGYRGCRISSQLLDGVLDNSRRPIMHEIKLLRPNVLDDRHDYRPFFTYWINTVHILVLVISLICYGVGPFGIGMEHKSGQVLVTSLNLQQVQHQEQRNVWFGPRSNDLVHLGAKFAACMRRDTKILDVMAKTKRQERETACCIRNDDSGCVQSSQADCSVRGLWPTQKTISTWKKWSPGDSGPGGRISGSVCGLDPKYCDAPASIAPYEWPDDITKWPICRKTNSFSHRFRLKDHTAEHMVCEVIGHPCCTGVYGECRITTKEYCDFVNGYFHEEASLCSQVSCLSNVCGMFPFMSQDVPDQFYRLFTSLCLHAGILHLAITVAFQHIFLSDLERLLGPMRTAIVYIGSGIAGNLTSAILVPYRPEVGPLASFAGVISSLSVLLTFCHWKQLKKPYLALIKLLLIAAALFGMGTLPWQQNFAGLIGGLVFGSALTFALVPFVNISKYNRKSKINLIWSCLLIHLVIYVAMFVIFYIFPSLFSSFGLIGGAHPNDHFATGQTGHFDHEHNNNLNVGGGVSNNNNNNNIFGGYNNYNTGGGIVSSGGMLPPYHLNIGGSSFSRSAGHNNANGIINTNINNNNIKQGHLGVGGAGGVNLVALSQPQLHQLQQNIPKHSIEFSEIGLNLENNNDDDREDDTDVDADADANANANANANQKKTRRQNKVTEKNGGKLLENMNRNVSLNQSPITPNSKSQKWQNVFYLRENIKENNTINFRS
ncbi:unnamed protein product [Diamesa serratosioi]